MKVSKEKSAIFWTNLRSKQAWRKIIALIRMELKYQNHLKQFSMTEDEWTRELFVQSAIEAY